MVVLKANKADLGAPALGQGVVYRLKVMPLLEQLMASCIYLIMTVFTPHLAAHSEQDSSITVAFDDIPDDGLNSPLRLEKLANEVCILLAHMVLNN